MKLANPILIRICDVALAVVMVAGLAAPMAVIAALIKAEDRGPALFVQRRVGRNGKPFDILKFRTMRVDADAGSGMVEGEGPEALAAARSRFRTTDVNDPRITRIGAPLRLMHLDELPQLFNVFAGDMSFVGVRPDTPAQQADYDPSYWEERHALRPGITGPAQLFNSSNLEERTARERTWLSNPDFVTYWTTLIATVGKVVKRSGI
jgi:lipopolysaccharide/colanic/teichoic acid biosynthesis glycosyltransferase